MLTEKQKLIEQMKELKSHLPKEKKEELAKILEFGEKYKKEGDEMEGKFWKNHKRKDFLNLISQYEESKQNFIKRLPSEEKEILDSLKGKSREKFYKEYLQEIILYRGDLERNSNDSDNNEIEISGEKDEIIERIRNVKGEFKPGMKIYLSWNNIRDEGVRALAEYWKNSLQPGMAICLRDNNIGAEGAKALADGWKNSLQPGMEINLSWNQIGAEGAQALAEKWKNSLQLGMEINLWDNNIGDEGVQALADGWKYSLQPGMRIDLSANNIGAEGAKALAKEWKNCLQPGMKICLNNNNIGDEGARTLAEKWKDSLQPGMEIDLAVNNIGEEGVQAIMDKLELKDGVKLILELNDFSEEKKEELRAWEEDYKRKGINCEVLF